MRRMLVALALVLSACSAGGQDGPTTITFWDNNGGPGRTPIYEELPGWKTDLSQITETHELPAAAEAYLAFLEEQVGVPVTLVGVGPGREQFVHRNAG